MRRSQDHACSGTWFARPCLSVSRPRRRIGKADDLWCNTGEDAPLDAAAALAMGLSARGPGGQAWYFSRAELPHSNRFQKSLSPSLPPQGTVSYDVRRSQREFGPSSSARSARR